MDRRKTRSLTAEDPGVTAVRERIQWRLAERHDIAPRNRLSSDMLFGLAKEYNVPVPTVAMLASIEVERLEKAAVL